MTVAQLIAELQKQDPNAKVVMEVEEPYDEEAETLTEYVSIITTNEDGEVVLL